MLRAEMSLAEAVADLERSYGAATVVCARWKRQRDALRVAVIYAADAIRDEAQPEDGTLFARVLALLEAALDSTREPSGL